MYSRQISPVLSVSGSPSLMANNLSINQSQNKFCYIKNSDVIVSDLRGECITLPLSKCDIYQVAFVDVQGIDVLVVASNQGVQFWSVDGERMLYYYGLNTIVSSEDEDSHYFKGVGGSKNTISVGTSFGSLLVFASVEAGAKDDLSFAVTENLSTAASPISCVCESSSYLVCGNDNGDVFAFNALSTYELTYQANGKGLPCTSIVINNNVIYAAYHSGHIRIFRPQITELSVEICAHVRPITGLAYSSGINAFVTCSEDQFVYVWSAPDFSSGAASSYHMDLLHAEKVDNRLCTGVGFLADDKICITSYDDEHIVVLKKD